MLYDITVRHSSELSLEFKIENFPWDHRKNIELQIPKKNNCCHHKLGAAIKLELGYRW